MGNCLAARVKAERPTRINPNNSASGESSQANEISRDSSSTGSGFTPMQYGDDILQTSTSSLRSFSYSDLRAATRKFRLENLLGEGGFGRVFKGWIDEHGSTATGPGTEIVIAVKKLNPKGSQGHREWLAEVVFLGQLHHPNLVKLIGYCAEDEHRLLVYEFMPRGNLENHLFRRGSYNQSLSWAIRMKVAVGAARGLAFLHNAQKPVIYRDFKTSNILLDSQYNAKLSDFGLAKDGPTGDDTHVSTCVMGTDGYAAPEYLATGRLTSRCDVYGFGVVLLEILTGRRAVDENRPGVEEKLVEWARPYLGDKRKLFRIIDSRLEGQYSMKGAHQAATLALSCINVEAKLRPCMKEVVETLKPLLNSREMGKYNRQMGSIDHVGRPQQGTGNRLHHQNNAVNLSPRKANARESNGASPLPAYQERRK